MSVPVSQISLPSGVHDNPFAPCAQPRAMAVGVREFFSRMTTSLFSPYGSRNTIRLPSGETRISCSRCGVSYRIVPIGDSILNFPSFMRMIARFVASGMKSACRT